MDPSQTEHVDQRLESVPWDDLVRPPRDSRRRVVLALLALVVAVVAASAARTLWPVPALTGSAGVGDADTSSAAAANDRNSRPNSTLLAPIREDSAQDDPPLDIDPPMSEADLRAVSPADASRAAVAYAELFVSQWLTLDGGPTDVLDAMLPTGLDAGVVDPSARSFVESAIGMVATEIGSSTWQVDVVVRTLSAFADGEYVRTPPRAYAVTVRLTDDGPAIVDLPSPAALPISQVTPLNTQPGYAPAVVMTEALSVMGLVGLVEEATLTTSKAGDAWRVAAVVRDLAGVPVRIAVWFDAEGRQIAVPTG